MATIGQIVDQAAFYLQQSRSSLASEGGQDMLMAHANIARKTLEKQHDFVANQAMAWLTVNPTSGGSLSDAKLKIGDTLTNTPCDVMSVDTVYLQDTTTSTIWFPLWFDQKKLLALKQKERNYKFRGYPRYSPAFQDDPLMRYPGDRLGIVPSRPFRAYWQGRTFYIDPIMAAERNIYMDVTQWMPDYLVNTSVSVTTSNVASATVTLTSIAPSSLVIGSTLLGRLVTAVAGKIITLAGFANETIAVPTMRPYSNCPGFVTNESYTDWLTEEGADYLVWAIVCDCNLFSTTFVPRQDGALPPPEKQRDAALSRLIESDVFQYEQARNPFNNR